MMADESRSEARPLESADSLPLERQERQIEPLRREVEPPRTAAGLWLPFMALASAAMLTITSGIAVMTRPPRMHIDGSVMTLPAKASAEAETAELKRTIDAVITAQRAVDARMRADQLKAQQTQAQARMDRYRVMCRVPVHRGDLDGDEQPYDECIVPPDVAAKAATGPEAR
jgi:hypothetical protein